MPWDHFYLDAKLHQRTHHWEALRDEFMGTFGFVGRIEVLNATLWNIDTVAWGESHLCIAPEVPTWEVQVLSMVDYHSLAPK